MNYGKLSKLTKVEIEMLVKDSFSIRELLQKMGYSPSSGSMFYRVKEKLKDLKIDTSHFGTKQDEKCGKISLSEILIKGSLYNRSHLKKRLVSDGLLEYECTSCLNRGEWNKKELVLQLDHINGDPTDNRLENLRFLCPNCHSQTDTFCNRT